MTDPRDHITDEWLVLNARSGDRSAFQRLVDRWQKRLWHHAFRLCGDSDLAWDAVQDTWMSVARGIGRLGDVAAFRGWIYRIVSRRVADLAGRARRNPEPVTIEPAEIVPHDNDGVQDVRDALARLPRERQALLALRYMEGFEVNEIAEILGVAEGTVKSRLHRAREEMRTTLTRKKP
jgi:RNA polymerase sigma-70 factor (ECF subfamily)